MYVGKSQDWSEGEARAWEAVVRLDIGDLCRRAKASYDQASGCYKLCVFNHEVLISPRERRMWGNSAGADLVLDELGNYSRLSMLYYLGYARDIPLSEELVNPENQSCALLFAKGTHVLPVEQIARRYGSDVAGFVRKGRGLGGVTLHYGDASVKLLPFPRVPVVLVLWQKDEEFPARANLLFDSTCTAHLPPDIIWSTAMLTILAMLQP